MSDELDGRVSDKQGEYYVSRVNLELILAQSQCVPGRPLLAPFIGDQFLRNRSSSIQITIRVTTQSHISTMIILGPNFHGLLPERILGVLR
jgi:hypothetical protein